MHLDHRRALCRRKAHLCPLNLKIHIYLVGIHLGFFGHKGAGAANARFGAFTSRHKGEKSVIPKPAVGAMGQPDAGCDPIGSIENFKGIVSSRFDQKVVHTEGQRGHGQGISVGKKRGGVGSHTDIYIIEKFHSIFLSQKISQGRPQANAQRPSRLI